MKNKMKKLLALALCATMCLALTACGGTDTTAESEVASDTKLYATAGGNGGTDVTLPEDFVTPTDNNRLANVLVDDHFVGVLHMSSYRTSGYFYISGSSVTIEANFSLYDANGESVTTRFTDLTVALWQKNENTATYVNTVHFVADGTNQTYTFDGLQPGGEYRLGITYTESGAYYASGTFSLSPVTGAGAEEDTPTDE